MIYSTRPLRVAEIKKMARKLAREAGLDANTADAVAQKAVDSLVPHLDIKAHINRVITEHAQP